MPTPFNARSHRCSLLVLIAVTGLLALVNARAAEPAEALKGGVATTPNTIPTTLPNTTPNSAAAAKPTLSAAQPVVQPAQQSGSEPLQKVEIKGAYDARRYDTATKIVVTQEEIEKYGDPTLGDVLKRLPGITSNGGVRMRGLGAGYTQKLINGQPVPQGFSIESLTPDMVERIEIMRSATAEFSNQAIAGTINIVLKSDAKLPTQAAKPLTTTLNTSASRAGGPGTSVNLFANGSTTELAYNFGGGLSYNKSSQNTTNQSTATVAGVPTELRFSNFASSNINENANLSARVTWTVSPTNTLTSQSSLFIGRFKSYSEGHTDVPLGIAPPFVQVNGDNNSSNVRASSDLVWIRTFADSAKLNTRVGVSYYQSDSSYNRSQYDTSNTLSLISVSDITSTDRNISTNGKYTTPLIEGHAIAVGWDAGFRQYNQDRVQNERSLLALTPDNVNTTNDAAVNRMALFAQDEWNVTQRWSVYAGVRWEGIWTTAGASNLASVKNRSSVASPLIHSLWKLPSSNDQLRSSITRTYKAPDTNSLIPFLYTSRENTVTTPDRQGNPNIKPELAWGADFSYEHFFPMNGQFSIGAFTRRINDVTHQQTVLIGQRWVSMRTNGGIATTRGIEMDTKLPLKLFWSDAPAIELRGNLTQTWSTLDTVPGPNNRLDSQTPFSGNIGVDYRSTGAKITAGGNFSFVSAGSVRVSLTDYTYATPNRALDMYAAYNFEKNSNLRISLSNALHQTALRETSYIDNTSSRTSRYVQPSTTRLMVGFSTKI